MRRLLYDAEAVKRFKTSVGVYRQSCLSFRLVIVAASSWRQIVYQLSRN